MHFFAAKYAFTSDGILRRKGSAMNHTPNRDTSRSGRGGQHEMQTTDYIYQVATIVAALLLLLTAAAV